jgi:inorganic triphosphatase YgiF
VIEVEQKISISAQELESVFEYFRQKYAINRIRHKFMPRDYYDTDDLDLYKNRISLRVQYKKGYGGDLGCFEQTVKSEHPASRINQNSLFRKELKIQLEDHQPDLSKTPDRRIKKVSNSFKNKSLKHIFTAAAERRFFCITLGSGKEKGKVELAFDVGTYLVLTDGSRHPMYEIEIESKGGNRKVIDWVCHKILKLAPSAKIVQQSKSQIGTQLYLAAKVAQAGAAP